MGGGGGEIAIWTETLGLGGRKMRDALQMIGPPPAPPGEGWSRDSDGLRDLVAREKSRSRARLVRRVDWRPGL